MMGLAAGIPVEQRSNDDANEADTSPRFSSGAESPRSTTIPQQYIQDLYESLYENGIPTGEATDVWAFVDKGELAIMLTHVHVLIKCYVRISISINFCLHFLLLTDIARESFREKLFVNTKCASYTQFVFQWSSAIQSLNIRNSTLHAYIQTIDGNFKSDEPVSVTLTVTMIPRRENGTSNTSDLSDPAEILLEQENLRKRQLDNQPFLVVFGDNEETKEALRKQKDDLGEMQVYDGRSKRSISTHSNSSCQISSYEVDLHDVGLTNVVIPRYINISKCSGTCNEQHVIKRLGTNHAKIMSTIYNQQMLSGEPVTATVPCCVPIKYETVVQLLMICDVFSIASYFARFNDLKATECGCR